MFALLASSSVVLAVFVAWLAFGGRRALDLASALGGVGSLVATAFVALTLWLQSRELALQRRELRLTRDEFQRHSHELKRQGDLLAQQSEKDVPRLALRLAWTSGCLLRLENLGGAAITKVYMAEKGGLNDGAELGRSTSLSPKHTIDALPITGLDWTRAKAALALQAHAPAVRIQFTDPLGSPLIWDVPTSSFEQIDIRYYQPSVIGSPDR